ncbi:MAG: hypothetical protein J6Q80_05145, partial [Lentisphaeria bacterium]|nr:hypothetical protein [Lentisphaeria bacterium]
MSNALKTTLLMLAAFAGVNIFAGNISGDELIFNAMMERNTTVRARLLISAAAAAPEKAAAPLALLLRQQNNPESEAEIFRAYTELWKKHPANTTIAACGILIGTRSGAETVSLLNNLKLHPEPWKSDGSTDEPAHVISTLNTTKLFLFSLCADNDNGIVFASKLDPQIYSFSLASFYNIMAYRFAVNGNEAGYKKMTELRRKMTDDWINSNRSELPARMTEIIDAAAKDKNSHFVHAVYKELENRLSDPRQLDALHLSAAQNTNDYSVAKRAVSKLKNIPDESKNHLLFYAALRAKNFGEAMRLAEKVPAKERANALRDIAVTFNNAELYRKVLADGNIPKELAADITLAAAIACQDKNLYYTARR